MATPQEQVLDLVEKAGFMAQYCATRASALGIPADPNLANAQWVGICTECEQVFNVWVQWLFKVGVPTWAGPQAIGGKPPTTPPTTPAPADPPPSSGTGSGTTPPASPILKALGLS
jgi:hypothetical protein